MRLLAYLALISLLYASDCAKLFAAQSGLTPGARLLLGQMTKEEFVELSKYEPDQPHLALHKARPVTIPKPAAAKHLALNTKALKLDKLLSDNEKIATTVATKPTKPVAKKSTVKSQTKPKHSATKKKTASKKTTTKSSKKRRSHHH